LSLDLEGNTDEALAYFEQAATAEPESEVFTATYHAARQPLDELSFPREKASSAQSQSHAPPTPLGITAEPIHPAISPLPQTELVLPAPVVGAAAQGPAGPHLRQASQALAGGSLVQGEELLCRAVRTASDNPQIPISAAVIALQHAQPQLAIELLQEGQRAFPRCAGIHQSLALAFYRIGNYEASQVAARQALSLDNTSPLTYFLLGSTAARLGSTDEAQRYLEQACRMDPRYGVTR
jgi:tetratricopeptide (TPR) repeat protein